MMELRKDYLMDRYSVVSSARAYRPKQGGSQSWEREDPSKCPFCPGNEKITPKETARIGGKKWIARSFRNKYPLFSPNAKLKNKTNGLMKKSSAKGYHEVIIDVRDHYLELEDLPKTVITKVFSFAFSRWKAISRKRGVKYSLLVKNRGPASGASIMHSHMQLMGMPIVPRLVREELNIAEDFYINHGYSIFDKIIELERGGPRFVYENPGVIAFVPFAPRANHSVWLVSKKETPRPGYLADAFKRVMLAMRDYLGNFSYNFFVHYPPTKEEEPFYRWHMEIMPRTEIYAGLELGSGEIAVVCPPEKSAREIRGRIP